MIEVQTPHLTKLVWLLISRTALERIISDSLVARKISLVMDEWKGLNIHQIPAWANIRSAHRISQSLRVIGSSLAKMNQSTRRACSRSRLFVG